MQSFGPLLSKTFWLDPGTVLRLFPQKRARIRLINDIFSIMSSYVQHVSPCSIFTEAKLKINATKLFFLITVTIVATIHTLASRSRFPPPCTHEIQTLIILKISNTIQCPSNSVTLAPGTEMVAWGVWGLFFSNQPSDTSALEVKHSWQVIALPVAQLVTRQHYLQGAPSLPSSQAPLPNKPLRRDVVNLFSQQRALEAGGGIINLLIGKTPHHYHSWSVVSILGTWRPQEQAWWTRSGWEAHLEVGARARRLRQTHPQVPRVSTCPPPSSHTSDTRAIWIIRLQHTLPCKIPLFLACSKVVPKALRHKFHGRKRTYTIHCHHPPPALLLCEKKTHLSSDCD